MKKNNADGLAGRGQVLVGVILVMLILLIMVPALITWIQTEARISVKNRKSTTAFNLAEAAVERGLWKAKSSTGTWAEVTGATVISGYNFDTTYTDVPGGTYRIKFTSTTFDGNAEVMVWGEGRDSSTKEVRSIQAVYENQTIPGAIIAGGTMKQAGTAVVHWGPVMAMNTITISGASLNWHFPRKLSKQAVVSSPAGSYDTTWPLPPNTDNLEWWAAYNVPELPNFDFPTMQSSATATMYKGNAHNTYNCNGSIPEGNDQQVEGLIPCNSTPGSCSSSGATCVVENIFADNRFDDNDLWYWENNVVMNQPGINGTVIVRGNLLTNGGDWYGDDGPNSVPLNLKVPTEAYLEYQKIDTAGTSDYPADNGLQKSKSTYILGSCGLACEGTSTGCDVGFYGFVYVGGDINVQGDADMYGAVWVVGNWYAAGNNGVFFNSNLVLPTLNVVLTQQSWKEVSPNTTTAWP